MCGVAGLVNCNHQLVTDSVLQQMTDSIAHRGPDGSGNWISGCGRVGLGHRRLSIIDLTAEAGQPMHYGERYTIVFNGEIYNFTSIRSELEKSGHQFVSKTDTEVILKAYQQWGIECVDRFVGMFAIALFIPEANKIIFIRDRAGVKPLFYYLNNGLFLFGSELKSFHQHPEFVKQLNNDALALYFQFGYVPAPYSIFQYTYKLQPGHFAELNLGSQEFRQYKYWDAVDAYTTSHKAISYSEAVEKTELLLTEVCNERMVADVPVGVFLSGGYDSTCVAALIQKESSTRLKTFTIGFEDTSYNEAPHAAKVAQHLQTDHHEYICTFKEAMDIIPQLPEIYDEPFGDSSAIPTTLVSRFAKKYVTVALSADAGDELFAGYPRHRKNVDYDAKLSLLPAFIGKILSATLPRQNHSLAVADRRDKLKQLLKATDTVTRFKITNQVFTENEVSVLLQSGYNRLQTAFDEGNKLSMAKDALSRILATEYKTYLVDDILQKVDRATMSASLEGREPLLDHRLLEWVAALPSDFKMNGLLQKRLLKDIVHRYVPEQIMKRPKMGFGIPVVHWMKNDLRSLFDEVMSDESVNATSVLNLEQVRAMRNAYLEGSLENFERLWFVFTFILWHRKWMHSN